MVYRDYAQTFIKKVIRSRKRGVTEAHFLSMYSRRHLINAQLLAHRDDNQSRLIRAGGSVSPHPRRDLLQANHHSPGSESRQP